MTAQLDLDMTPPKRRRASALEHYHAQGQPVTVEEALAGEAKAKRQEDQILDAIRLINARWMPSQVHAVFPDWPITSIRRALTNLTKAGLLVHHARDRRPGPLGAKESTWSLA